MTTSDKSPLLTIETFISKTLTMQTSEALLDYFTAFISDVGFEHVAFFVLASNNQYAKQFEGGMAFHNFPLDWINEYAEKKYLHVDPMVELSKTAPRPFRWMLERGDDPHLSAGEKDVIQGMRHHGFQAGLVVPIYLPGGFLIHCALATKKSTMDMSPGETIEIGYLCHQVYNRYKELSHSENTGIVISLSRRESDVLHWAAMGKSNTIIADILGISPHTVDTMMRRCFKKLNVSNRTSAVLKAVSNGLISP